jgi:hypothetical protein
MINYKIQTFAALVVNILNLIVTPEMLENIFVILAAAFNLPEIYSDFMLNQYIPLLHKVTAEKEISLNQVEKTALAFKFGGVMVKMLYAFLWQEVCVLCAIYALAVRYVCPSDLKAFCDMHP